MSDDLFIRAATPDELAANPPRPLWCAVCNEEIQPGQPAEIAAPQENVNTSVHLECPQAEQ